MAGGGKQGLGARADQASGQAQSRIGSSRSTGQNKGGAPWHHAGQGERITGCNTTPLEGWLAPNQQQLRAGLPAHLLQVQDDAHALGLECVDVVRVARLAADNHVGRNVVVVQAALKVILKGVVQVRPAHLLGHVLRGPGGRWTIAELCALSRRTAAEQQTSAAWTAPQTWDLSIGL